MNTSIRNTLAIAHPTQLVKLSDMSCRFRAARITLANLKPAPKSQQNVRIFLLCYVVLPSLMESHHSKNEWEGVKVRDTGGQQVVVQTDKNLAPDQALGLALKEDRHQ